MIACDRLVNCLLAQRGPPSNDTSLSTLLDLDLLLECLLKRARVLQVVGRVLRFAAFRIAADTGWPPPVRQTIPPHFVFATVPGCRSRSLARAFTVRGRR